MKPAALGVLLVAATCAGGALAVLSDRREPPKSPLLCAVNLLPTQADESTVVHLCGPARTWNVSFATGHKTDEWVYDADTFLWFVDGKLSSMKIGEDHAAEQRRFSVLQREPIPLCH